MNCKYIILVGDGMGDYPLDELEGKTPLEAARTPHMDRLVSKGRMGTVRTVPKDMDPGSDVANMSLLGYDPLKYHTGRAPLEAASMGISLLPHEVAFRCNLVTLEKDVRGVTRMGDYSAGHITTAEAHELILALQKATTDTPLRLYAGVSYRHLLVWAGGRDDLGTTPPHDISGEPAAPYQEVYRQAPVLASFIERAGRILADHSVNRQRLDVGKRPANAVWLWGQGRAPSMPTLRDKFDLTGAMISAVDLLKGLGVYAGLDPIAVSGATGYLDTNYAGKVSAALEALETGDFVYVHVEAPDEASHEGSLSKKIAAIEAFDSEVVGPIVEGTARFSKLRLMIVTDHLTPIVERTHVADPVPFLIVEDGNADAPVDSEGPSETFCEKTALAEGRHFESGVDLFEYYIGSSSKAS